MPQTELRAEPRVPLHSWGILTLDDDTSAPCLIQNMCSKGFLLKYTQELPVGQVLALRCQLYPAGPIDCKVQVRHVNAEWLGAKVIEISDEGKTRCRQFLEAQRTAPGP